LPRSKRFRMGQAALHLTIIAAGRKEIQNGDASAASLRPAGRIAPMVTDLSGIGL
jgi:hypothetical protein